MLIAFTFTKEKTTSILINWALLMALFVGAKSLNAQIPKTLRELVLEADCIVYGKVLNVSSWDSKIRSGFHAQSLVIAKDWLKGEHQNDTIEIYDLAPKSITLRLPKYPKGKEVICFLKRDTLTKSFSTHGYQVGVKEVSKKDYKAYKSSIASLQKVYSNSQPKTTDVISWLIACAQNKATRKEGLVELNSFNPLFNAENNETGQQTKSKILNDQQKTALRNLALKENVVFEASFLDYIKTDTMDYALIKHLYYRSLKQEPKYVNEEMEKIVEYTQNKDLEGILAEVKEIDWSRANYKLQLLSNKNQVDRFHKKVESLYKNLW